MINVTTQLQKLYMKLFSNLIGNDIKYIKTTNLQVNFFTILATTNTRRLTSKFDVIHEQLLRGKRRHVSKEQKKHLKIRFL